MTGRRVLRTGVATAAVSGLHVRRWQRLERRVLGQAPAARRALIARRSGLAAAMRRLKEYEPGR